MFGQRELCCVYSLLLTGCRAYAEILFAPPYVNSFKMKRLMKALSVTPKA